MIVLVRTFGYLVLFIIDTICFISFFAIFGLEATKTEQN
jgi:hypothetical protein